MDSFFMVGTHKFLTMAKRNHVISAAIMLLMMICATAQAQNNRLGKVNFTAVDKYFFAAVATNGTIDNVPAWMVKDALQGAYFADLGDVKVLAMEVRQDTLRVKGEPTVSADTVVVKFNKGHDYVTTDSRWQDVIPDQYVVKTYVEGYEIAQDGKIYAVKASWLSPTKQVGELLALSGNHEVRKWYIDERYPTTFISEEEARQIYTFQQYGPVSR